MDHQAAKALNDLELMLLDETAEPRALPLSLLQDITNGFSADREIGKGGFAVVYRGILGNGTVAVKRLSNNTCMDEKKFIREVECLMKAKHKNIVRFLGYCAETKEIFLNYEGKSVMAEAQEKLLCFEYLSKGNLRNYITADGPCKLEWRQCYQIIKGICQGLHYLHENHILHLDLKPENVLLDEHMVPKIADFGLSRCFEENQISQFITSNVSGTLGYIAPELVHNGKRINVKSDIYSLGIIIIEILTGQKGYPDVEDVLDSWRNRLVEDMQFEQVRICNDMGIECSDFNPSKRPVNTEPIVKRLQETEPEDEVSAALSVQPRVLYFPCAPSTPLIPSSLYLTNNTDEHVVFSLVENANKIRRVKRCFKSSLQLYGIVAPRSTHSLVLNADDQPKNEKLIIDLILESCTLGADAAHMYMQGIQSKSMLRGLFEKARDLLGDNTSMVQKVILKAAISPVTEQQPSKKLTPSEMKIIRVRKTEEDEVMCFDVNPTKEWVITGHKKGFVRIWNYLTEQRKVHSFKVSYKTVKSVKFVEQKKWFIVASDDDFIHVYNYERELHKITSFRGGSIVAVHPSKPYMLSASSRRVELWCWYKDWECAQLLFEIDHCATPSQVVFNPTDTDTYAIAFKEHTVVEIRRSELPGFKYTLCGHTGVVNCLDFFTRDDQQYLITGSDDCSAKIWDMQKYMCIYTLQASVSSVMSVLFNPNRQNLITGSKDGTIYLWSSTNFRLERIINTGASSGGLWGLTYFMGSKGILIGKGSEIAMIMDIDNLKYKEESTHTSEPQFTADLGPGDRTTDQGIPAGKIELLDVHPLELRLPSREEDSIVPQMMHLTNKTDERVAFRLLGDDKGVFGGERFAIIPSRCTYTLVLLPNRQSFRGKKNLDLLLKSIISGDKCIVPLQEQSQCNELFEELIETENTVHEVAVRAVSHPQGEVINESNVDYIISQSHRRILDAHPTEPWILESDSYYIVGKGLSIQDVFTRELLMVLRYIEGKEIKRIEDTFSVVAECGKFIGRMEWIVIGTSDGFIHVYAYGTRKAEKITSFQASTSTVTLLAIHPTLPYVLSAAKNGEMKLWSWDVVEESDWDCAQTYEVEHTDDIFQLTFNPKDTKTFVSASGDHTVKVWSLDSTKSNYTLFGHSSAVTCLDFFTRDDTQYLLSGSKDATVKIWDLQKRVCVHTTGDLMSPVFSVTSLPDRPYLLIGLQDGTVHLWSSSHFRSERIFNYAYYGFYGAARVHLLGSKGVLTIQDRTVSIMGAIDAFAMDIDSVIEPTVIKGRNEPEEDMDNFSNERK